MLSLYNFLILRFLNLNNIYLVFGIGIMHIAATVHNREGNKPKGLCLSRIVSLQMRGDKMFKFINKINID